MGIPGGGEDGSVRRGNETPSSPVIRREDSGTDVDVAIVPVRSGSGPEATTVPVNRRGEIRSPVCWALFRRSRAR